jgi:hypothetical protein
MRDAQKTGKFGVLQGPALLDQAEHVGLGRHDSSTDVNTGYLSSTLLGTQPRAHPQRVRGRRLAAM